MRGSTVCWDGRKNKLVRKIEIAVGCCAGGRRSAVASACRQETFQDHRFTIHEIAGFRRDDIDSIISGPCVDTKT